MRRNWAVQKPDKELVSALRTAGCSRVLAVLLVNRGICDEAAAQAFLSGEGCFHDAFMLKDMEKAALCVQSAIEHNERITVYGDYDADGVTATA